MMKLIKKKGGKFRIEHNKTLFWIIILLIIILGFLIYTIVKNSKTDNGTSSECSADGDCAAVCGCHPESCIPEKQRGECPNAFCTQVCSGPLDCGAGSCGCVKGKCQVVPNK